MAHRLSDDQIEKFTEAFSLIDKDSDGIILAKELGTLLRSLGQNPTEVELQDMINGVDNDGKGTIDLPSFLCLVAGFHNYHDNTEDELIEAFKVFDKDGDTRISEEDLRQVLRNEAAGELTEEEIDGLIREADIDDNGMINYKDFLRMMMAK